MRLFRDSSTIALALALLLVCACGQSSAQSSKSRTDSKAHSKRSHYFHLRRGSWKHHGQQHIDDQRAREIQSALIREKYLDGEPSGVWDRQTKDALTKYQADHGWQTKMLPDSRALIALGLGPKADDNSLAVSQNPATSSAGHTSPLPLELMQRQQ